MEFILMVALAGMSFFHMVEYIKRKQIANLITSFVLLFLLGYFVRIVAELLPKLS